MILQNLSRAIREQNYYAVALEFVIVIAGVVIGFQINAWNEHRTALDRAQALTMRLGDDLAMERLNVIDTIAYYTVVIANAEDMASDLRSETVMTEEALVIAAYRATQFPGFARFRSAYDELVSTGALPLVKDDGLRRVSGLLYGTGIYNAHLSDSGGSAFRTRFRGLVPGDVQRALNDVCGDRVTPAPPGGRESIDLDYPCTLPVAPETLENVARGLREDVELKESLRQRIADLDTALNNLEDLLVSMESLTGDRLEAR